MSTRNKLLEQIVLALGGTVTNPNNRNQLLQDWLAAAGGSPTSTRLVPSFNGISQYAEVAPAIPVLSGDTASFKFIPSQNIYSNFRMFLANSSLWFIAVNNESPTNKFRLNGCSATLDGAPITDSVTPYPDDGLKHEIVVTFNSSGSVQYVGANNALSVFCDFPIFDLKINEGTVYNFPMDDGWANNPTMRNAGTGADGTFINMTEAAWVEIQQ